MKNTTAASLKLTRMLGIVTGGPTASNKCPISHGTVIPPMLTPTKNQALTRPLMETPVRRIGTCPRYCQTF